MFQPGVNVCDELPAQMLTLASVVTHEHCDGVHWQHPQVGAAPETPDRSRCGQVLQFVLVSYGTL